MKFALLTAALLSLPALALGTERVYQVEAFDCAGELGKKIEKGIDEIADGAKCWKIAGFRDCHKFYRFKPGPLAKKDKKMNLSCKNLADDRVLVQVFRWNGAVLQRVRHSKLKVDAATTKFREWILDASFK